MALIEARGVSHTYNGANNVLDGVDLTVERGEFVSVLGASGSGKTTLISILGGIERPSSGSVFLDGAEITRMKERQLAVLRRTKLGFVFQFFNLAPYLTAEQNILVPVYLRSSRRNVGRRTTTHRNSPRAHLRAGNTVPRRTDRQPRQQERRRGYAIAFDGQFRIRHHDCSGYSQRKQRPLRRAHNSHFRRQNRRGRKDGTPRG